MADWTSITDAQVDPDAPLTSELAYAWRDNPIAITEGALGAPRISFPAMGSWFTTAGGVGTYCFAAVDSGIPAFVNFGSTTSGSNLRPTSAAMANPGPSGYVYPVSGALSGTWRAMGEFGGTIGSVRGATLWVRIA